jgi:hypothetical protein
MKKVLISLAAGAIALGGALPASAGPIGGDGNGNSDDSIWEQIDNNTSTLEDLVLIAGMATMLDACGNGKPFYTFFAPSEGLLRNAVGGIAVDLDTFLEDVLGVSVADLQATPDVVRALLNDHLVNGSFSPWQLDSDSVTTLIARSGFVLRNENGDSINDLTVLSSEQACNGWIYYIDGVLDSTPQVPTEGLNAQDSPTDGTPGGSNSLPDTL